MILSAGLSSRIEKCGFARKARQNSEVYTKIQSGGQCTRKSALRWWSIFCTDFYLSKFPEKKSAFIFYEVWFLKHFPIYLGMQENIN